MSVREEILCRVTGRVQLVMYRDFVQRKANSIGVVGAVKNLSDGSVEVVAQGSPDELKRLIERLHEGSILARVEDVAVEWRSPSEKFDDFRIIF